LSLWAFSPDGATIALCRQKGKLMLFDAKSGARLWEVTLPRPIRALAFAAADRLLLSGAGLEWRRASDGAVVHAVPGDSPFGALAVFRRAGSFVVARGGAIERRSLADGAYEWGRALGMPTFLAALPGDRFVMQTNSAGPAALRRLEDGGLAQSLDEIYTAGSGIVVAASADGRFLAASLFQGAAPALRLWRTAPLEPLWTMPGTALVEFLPDGETLLHVDGTGRFVHRRVADGEALEERALPSVAARVAAAPAGRTIAVVTPFTCSLHDLEGGPDRILPLEPAYGDLAARIEASPDGRRLAALSLHALQVWDADGRYLYRRDVRSGRAVTDALAFSPDGAHLFVGGLSPGEVQILRAEDGALVGSVSARPRPFFATDGATLCLPPEGDGPIRRHRLADGAPLPPLELPGPHQVVDLALTPDGARVLALALPRGSQGDSVALFVWDAASAAIVATQPLPRGTGLRLSRDGRRLAIAYTRIRAVGLGGDYGVQLADPADGTLLQAFEVPTPLSARALAFSPDGLHLAVSEGTAIALVRLSDGLTVAKFGEPSGGLAFSADGRRLVAVGLDTTVREYCDLP
jgi:WD40 repeat protein